ncbi:MAG: hypothetical protein ACLTI1_06165 [Clostridia bacterium]
MAILQEGFRQLEEDRKKFEQERQILIEEAREQQATGQAPGEGSFTAVQLYSGSQSAIYGRDTGI